MDKPKTFAAALHTSQMGTGRFKGTKLKTESDYQVRSISALTGNGVSLPHGGSCHHSLSMSAKDALLVFISDKGKGKCWQGMNLAWMHSL